MARKNISEQIIKRLGQSTVLRTECTRTSELFTDASFGFIPIITKTFGLFDDMP